jgi:hypothetical protein
LLLFPEAAEEIQKSKCKMQNCGTASQELFAYCEVLPEGRRSGEQLNSGAGEQEG